WRRCSSSVIVMRSLTATGAPHVITRRARRGGRAAGRGRRCVSPGRCRNGLVSDHGGLHPRSCQDLRRKRMTGTDLAALLGPVRAGNAFEETVERVLTVIKLGLVAPGERFPPE